MTDLRALIEQELQSRKPEGRGNKVQFQCPMHDDGHRSAVWWKDEGNWTCRGCGKGGPLNHLAEQLGIPVETPKERAEKWVIVATYDYPDGDGKLLFQKLRYANKARFSLRRPDGRGGWIGNMQGVSRVLYGLPELRASTDSFCLSVEGEKDADTGRRLGFTTTTQADGAAPEGAKPNWKPSYNEELKKFETVVVIPDHDAAGYNEAKGIALSLHQSGIRVKWLDLWEGEPLPKKHGKDLTDWTLEKSGTHDDLASLIEDCPYWAPVSEPSGLNSFDLTHNGQALLFAHLYGDKVRYDHLRGRWLVWDRHRWKPDPGWMTYNLAIDAAKERHNAAGELNGKAWEDATKFAHRMKATPETEKVLKAAGMTDPIHDDGKGWDANPYQAGVANGTLNLVQGTGGPGLIEDRITMNAGAAYVPGAAAPRWERFIREIFAKADGTDDPEMCAFVQRMCGLFLTGDVKAQVWFLFHGSGENGKSVFLNVMLKLLGDYAGITGSATLCGKSQLDGSAAEPNIIALRGKRLVVCNESGIWATLNAERMKELTGGTDISARGLYSKEAAKFTPTHKLVIATNTLPTVNDDSHAMWRRIRLIPFIHTFTGAKRDDDLEENLMKELEGILVWCLAGAVDYLKNGGMRLDEVPRRVRLATLAYKEAQDVLADFITEKCVLGEEERVSRASIYAAYKAWGDVQGYRERDILGVNVFSKKMGERFKNVKSNGQRMYHGIRLRKEGDPKPATDEEETSLSFEPETEGEGRGGRGLGKSSRSDPSYGEVSQNGVRRVPASLSPEMWPEACDCEAVCFNRPECQEVEWEGMHCLLHHPEMREVTDEP